MPIKIRTARVEWYCHLGVIINEKRDNTRETKCHTGKTRTAYNKMSAFLMSHNNLPFKTVLCVTLRIDAFEL